MVEFALLLPVLLLLVLGIGEFGRAYSVQTTLSGAAREGVRVMALHNDPSAARAATKAAAPFGLSDAQITVATVPAGGCTSGATTAPMAAVTVQYQFAFLSGFLGSGVTLHGKGVMRCNG